MTITAPSQTTILWFDEQRLETGRPARIEAPALPDNSYSPQGVITAPVDSTH